MYRCNIFEKRSLLCYNFIIILYSAHTGYIPDVSLKSSAQLAGFDISIYFILTFAGFILQVIEDDGDSLRWKNYALRCVYLRAAKSLCRGNIRQLKFTMARVICNI